MRIARFLGDGSFQAMLLPPKARVRINEFPITFIDEPPKTEITVPVTIAEKLISATSVQRIGFPWI